MLAVRFRIGCRTRDFEGARLDSNSPIAKPNHSFPLNLETLFPCCYNSAPSALFLIPEGIHV